MNTRDLRAVARRSGYAVRLAELPGDYCGLTDLDNSTIWLDATLSRRALRSTLAHEIVHARLGHGPESWRGHEEPWLEAAVDVIAAGMLFTEDDYTRVWASKARPTTGNVAASLGVDEPLLMAWWNLRKFTLAQPVE